MLERLLVTIKIILSMIIVTGCLGGCVTARKVDSSTLSKYEGFIHEGKTPKGADPSLKRVSMALGDFLFSGD
jgi:hypothetical protein